VPEVVIKKSEKPSEKSEKPAAKKPVKK